MNFLNETSHPPIGSVVQVPAYFNGIPYKHVGFVDMDGTVLHFNQEAIGLVRSSLSDFQKNRELEVTTPGINWLDFGAARERLTSFQSNSTKYHWLLNNCEHFAYYLHDGNRRSPQAVLFSLIALAAITGAALLFKGAGSKATKAFA